MHLIWSDSSFWLGDDRMWVTPAALGLLLVLAWIAARIRKRRRVASILGAIQDSTFARCVPQSRTGAWGIAVALQPAPEPFRTVHISYRAVSPWNPADWPRWLFWRDRNRLQFAATLAGEPVAELLWLQGRHPLTLVGTEPGRAPWVQSRLEISRAEYATRGADASTLRHVFAELHVRHFTQLRLVTVRREQTPQIRIVLEGRIDPRAISPLMAMLTALGRAASLS